MNRIYELINIYIKDQADKKDKYEVIITKNSLYDNLLELLTKNYDSIYENRLMIELLLDSLYDNSYSLSFSKLIFANDSNALIDFINKLKQDNDNNKIELLNLEKEIIDNKSIVSSGRKILLNIKYHSPIDIKFDMLNGKSIIEWACHHKFIDEKECLLLCNEITFYNNRLNLDKKSKNEQDFLNDLYAKIPNILNMGYLILPKPEIPNHRKESLIHLANNIYNQLKSVPLNSIK